MISEYTISISNRDVILKKGDNYKEHEIYIDKNKMYLGNYVLLTCDNGIKKKKKKIELDHRYAYNIGISFYNNDIYIHLYKYIPFVDNQYEFEYYHKELLKWTI